MKFSIKKKGESAKGLGNYNYDFNDNVSIQLSEQDIDTVLKEINKDIKQHFSFSERSSIKKVKLSNYNYRFKSNKTFYGEGKAVINHKSKLLAHNISLKSDIEASLNKREIVLKERIEAKNSKTLITSTDVLKEKIDKLANAISINPKLFLFIGSFIISVFDNLFKNVSELLSENEIDATDYKYIIDEYEEIKRGRKLVRSLSKQISFQLNLTKKRLRNLRHIFTQQHSFHFKNLEDHDSASFNLSF